MPKTPGKPTPRQLSCTPSTVHFPWPCQRAYNWVMSSYTDTSRQTTELPSKPRSYVLYPQAYIWFVFLSAMDVCMTVMVLHWGGSEVNVLADAVIQRWGWWV